MVAEEQSLLAFGRDWWSGSRLQDRVTEIRQHAAIATAGCVAGLFIGWLLSSVYQTEIIQRKVFARGSFLAKQHPLIDGLIEVAIFILAGGLIRLQNNRVIVAVLCMVLGAALGDLLYGTLQFLALWFNW
jgi:membrane protein YqaA with SNARE-associated domain